jgi:hypothetical protein
MAFWRKRFRKRFTPQMAVEAGTGHPLPVVPRKIGQNLIYLLYIVG